MKFTVYPLTYQRGLELELNGVPCHGVLVRVVRARVMVASATAAGAMETAAAFVASLLGGRA